MEKRNKHIELKSEALNEVLKTPPAWLARSGSTLVFLVILLLIVLSNLISYNDEVVGQVELFRDQLPVEFHKDNSDNFLMLHVKNGEYVKKGKRLATIEYPNGQSTSWIAPINGKIISSSSMNGAPRFGNIDMFVLSTTGKYRGVISIPEKNATNIKPGQPVFIELYNYPATEFGMLEGKVISIGSISKKGFIEVGIELPNQLITSYKKEISDKKMLKGEARIITLKKRLFDRLFEKLLVLF